jgi:hypothetical protein
VACAIATTTKAVGISTISIKPSNRPQTESSCGQRNFSLWLTAVLLLLLQHTVFALEAEVVSPVAQTDFVLQYNRGKYTY